MWPWGAAKKVSVCTVSREEREELGEIPPTPFLSLVFGQQLNFIDSFWVQTTSFFSLPMHIRRATSNRMMTPPLLLRTEMGSSSKEISEIDPPLLSLSLSKGERGLSIQTLPSLRN